MEGQSERGRNSLQNWQSLIRTEGWMKLTKRRREGNDKSYSMPREQKVQRLKEEDMFGGLSSRSSLLLLLCKVHKAGREDESWGPKK